VVLVRVLLFLALAAIVVALFLYFYRRDRRYLRFVIETIKFTIVLAALVLIGFAVARFFRN
jgi:hypothetical protein